MSKRNVVHASLESHAILGRPEVGDRDPLTFELLEVSAKRRLSHTLSRGWESYSICHHQGKQPPNC